MLSKGILCAWKSSAARIVVQVYVIVGDFAGYAISAWTVLVVM